ncbi:Holliday junction branch migration protein RuvA [Sodalis sp. CWE]|uniref:Holliday junction branch migration protein RuvA n=1 Tax=Sodalis sp. CWE TaxID=2803816 RepID=UPI001C7D5F48|nr:Holliday junction branch migration protein RuvA [Sodalis sp. CWE]MBX4181229.1 Holliday junction branch migration protein RuvA [Sodalis sp. CWE]
MIGRLKGVILEKQPKQILLETCGVGYEILIPMSCFYALPKEGEEVVIFTHFIARQDSQLLFGFVDKQEQVFFRELIKINGIGPQLALSILSKISMKQLFSIIVQQEISTLIKLPGVGKKIAKRLITEMKDKYQNLNNKNLFLPFPLETNKTHSTSKQKITALSDKTLSVSPEGEAISVLVALGYKLQEAIQMVNRVSSIEDSCESIIRNALRNQHFYVKT